MTCHHDVPGEPCECVPHCPCKRMMCAPGWTPKSFARRVFVSFVLTANVTSGQGVVVTAYRVRPDQTVMDREFGFAVGSVSADGRFWLFDSMESRTVPGTDLEVFLHHVRTIMPVAVVMLS